MNPNINDYTQAKREYPMISAFAKLIFGDEDYEAWENCGVYVGRLSDAHRKDKAVEFFRMGHVAEGDLIPVFCEVRIDKGAIEEKLRTNSIDVINRLFEYLSIFFDCEDYRKDVGLPQGGEIVLIGIAYLLIKGESDGAVVTLRGRAVKLFYPDEQEERE